MTLHLARLKIIALLVWLPLCALGQDASSEALVAAGKVLLTQLQGVPEHDAAIFRQVGADRAQQFLQALMTRGLSKTATLDDWAGLHGAFSGLTDLEIFRNNLPKAATYAFFNDTYYRTNEHDYQAALACARQALELNRQAGQPLYLMHKAVGEDLRALGRLPEAMEALRQAESEWPDPVDKTAGTLGQEIAQTLLAQGKREEAGKQVESMRHRTPGASLLFQSRAKLAEAELLFADKKFAVGIASVKAAVAVTKGTPDADTCGWEAAAQLSTAVLDGLTTLTYQEALDLARLADAQVPGLPVQVAPFAETVIRQRRRLAGELDAVLREDTERVEQARQSGNLGALAENLRSLAASYGFVNEMRQRAVALEQAVAAEKQMLPADGSPIDQVHQRSYLSSLNALGETYVELSQSGPARRAFDTVLKMYASSTAAADQKRLRSLQEEAVMGKAATLALDDDPDSARDTLQKLLTTISEANRPYALLQLGKLERTLNEKPVVAVDAYLQAIDGLRTGLDYPQELATRLTLARYLATKAATRVPDAAKKAAEQLAAGEEIARRMQYTDAEWRLEYIHGILAEADPPAAIVRYRQAVAKLDQMRGGLSQQEQRQSFVDNESVADLYARLIALLAHAGLRDDAWRFVENAKARSFVEALQGRRFVTDSPTPAMAQLQATEKQIVDVQFQLSAGNEQVLRAAGREPEALRAQLKDLEAKFTLARQSANLSESRSGQVLSLQPAPLAQIQKTLGAHAVLVEYGLLDGEMTAFVVTSTSADQLVWKVDTAKLRQNVQRLRGFLAAPEAGDWQALAGEVSKTLIAPLAAKIPRNATQMLIVPPAYLNYLPFQVLSLPDGRGLIDAYAVSYLPNASALLYLGKETPKVGSLFIGALGTSSADGMPPLPGTLTEAAGIAAEYPSAIRASNSEFTHDAARQALLTDDTAHFATHGILEEDAPLFSAILTSAAAGQSSRLSLYEIVGMKVRAHLVVLSACETGLGRGAGGDEITGLTRTLLAAGSDAVVASLWRVNDESTSMLMQEFYRRMAGGLPPAAAMREAALTVRAKYKHPFYWAPFVVTGRN